MPGARKKKKSLKDMSPPQRTAVLASIAVALVIVTAAQRDIQRRPAAEIRGQKWLWRLVCLNALGAIAYFRFGRRATV
jgi:hypothetical protein